MTELATPHLGLPLPDPDGSLETDVLRLREALSMLDTAVGTLRAFVLSDDLNLDTVQEIVNVLKAAQGDIGDVTELLATKASTDQLLQLQTVLSGQLTAMQEGVDQALAAKANASDVNATLEAKADAVAVQALEREQGTVAGRIFFNRG